MHSYVVSFLLGMMVSFIQIGMWNSSLKAVLSYFLTLMLCIVPAFCLGAWWGGDSPFYYFVGIMFNTIIFLSVVVAPKIKGHSGKESESKRSQ